MIDEQEMKKFTQMQCENHKKKMKKKTQGSIEGEVNWIEKQRFTNKAIMECRICNQKQEIREKMIQEDEQRRRCNGKRLEDRDNISYFG